MTEDKGGRPSKLTEELTDEITKVVRAGNYIETAAAYAGISKSSLYNWLRRGREERERVERGEKPKARESVYLGFLDAVEKALAQSEIRDVTMIAKAAQDSWQASAWRLERRFPFKWGRREHHHVDDGGETEHRTLLDLLLAAKSADEESNE